MNDERGSPPGAVNQFKVHILSPVTDDLLFLNERKMTSCIRRDGFV